MFEVTIHIPGLKELAEAIMLVANKGGQPSVQPPVQVSAPQPQVQPAVPIQAPVQTPMPQQVPTQQAVPVQPPIQQQEVTPAQIPTSTQTYTQDDLARAAMTLMDAGKQQELLQLLNQFGVEALPALPQGQYGAFATALRGMGAHI